MDPPQIYHQFMGYGIAGQLAMPWFTTEPWRKSRCQAKSLYTRDWREAIDPIWGRRYFINRWSGRLGPQEMGPQNMALEFDPARKRGWKMSETTKNW